MSPVMLGGAVALAAAAGWAPLYVAAKRRVAEGDAGRARGANLAMLVATIVASVATCGAPVAVLTSAFGDVALAPPAEKATVLEAAIDSARPVMWLALLSIPILVAGGSAFASNRRRLGEAAPRSSIRGAAPRP